MAKVRSPLLSATATGTLGDMLGFVRNPRAAVARSIARVRAAALAGQKRPASTAQQPVRDRWAAGCLAWQALNGDDKDTYRLRAAAIGLTGFNLFMREFNPAPPAAPIPSATFLAVLQGESANAAILNGVAAAGASTLVAFVVSQSQLGDVMTDSNDNTWSPMMPDVLFSPYPGHARAYYLNPAGATLTDDMTITATSQNGYPSLSVTRLDTPSGYAAALTGANAKKDTTDPYESDPITASDALLIAFYAPDDDNNGTGPTFSEPWQRLYTLHDQGTWMQSMATMEVAAQGSYTATATDDPTDTGAYIGIAAFTATPF